MSELPAATAVTNPSLSTVAIASSLLVKLTALYDALLGAIVAFNVAVAPTSNDKVVLSNVTPVTGVTLDKSTLSLEEGATATLNATIAPSNASYKAVSFTSSDDAIATVDDDGLVTAVAEGSADITVESIADGSKTAVCTLTVTAKTIAVTGVAIEPKTATLEIGETQQLTPTVTPENASDKTVTYASNAQGIASVDDNGLITGKAEGTTQIVVTTKDGNKSATCDVTVNPPEPEPEPEVPEEPEE